MMEASFISICQWAAVSVCQGVTILTTRERNVVQGKWYTSGGGDKRRLKPRRSAVRLVINANDSMGIPFCFILGPVRWRVRIQAWLKTSWKERLVNFTLTKHKDLYSSTAWQWLHKDRRLMYLHTYFWPRKALPGQRAGIWFLKFSEFCYHLKQDALVSAES